MKFKIVAIVLSAALATLMTPTSASAAGFLLLQENQNGSGGQCQFGASSTNIGYTSCVFGGDAASRAVNNSGTAWVLYDDANYGDRHYCIKPNQSVNLHNSAYNFGDKITSVKELSGTSCAGYPTF